MKRLALILMLALAAGCDETSPSRSVSHKAQERRVFAFTAEWCVPCKRNMPVIKRLQKSGVKVIYIDIDKRPNTAKSFSVERVPTYIVYTGADGEYDYKEISRTHSVEVLRKLLGK